MHCHSATFSIPACNRRDKVKKTPPVALKKEKFSFQTSLYNKPTAAKSLQSDYIPIGKNSEKQPTGAINLLELERQNKKKRKSLQSSVAVPVAKKPSIAGPSLGSLQSLMNRK